MLRQYSYCYIKSVLTFKVAKHGLGQDVWNLSFDNITYISYVSFKSTDNQHPDKPQLFFWDELIYLSALPITKISILLFYLRIFPRQGFKYCVYALIAANVGYLISFEVISIWQCRPIDAAWKRWDGTYAAVRALGFIFPYLECFLSCEAVLLCLLNSPNSLQKYPF